MNPAVVFLMGPTASGKTDLAVRLCHEFPMEIVSVDSAMVYRGMDIGTAKPSKAIRKTIPHHLIDICDPRERYSAAQFREDALEWIGRIVKQGKVPLLVGGTGLYFRALETGLADMPAADPVVRERLTAEARQSGWQAMHDQLRRIDPAAAQRIHPNDPQRIQRALEVYEISGQPLSEFHQTTHGNTLGYDIIKLVIAPEKRQILHQRIEKRFDAMLEQGLIEEVKSLHQRGDLDQSLPSIRMVGYRQVWQYLDKVLDYPEMRAHAIVATRQLAKRQLTWFRREKAATWFDSQAVRIEHEISKYLIEKSIKSA